MTKVPHILIIEANFYKHITQELFAGAKQALEKAGATFEHIEIAGAFEAPAALSFALKQRERTGIRRYDGYIVLGCVIRGETSHYDYVCGESARGLMTLSYQNQLALGYGILTVENEQQALARALVSRQNKGGAVAEGCLAMVTLRHHFNFDKS